MHFVAIIVSANTAFDILEDSHSANLQTHGRPIPASTYIVPVEYPNQKNTLGTYDADTATTGWNLSLPTFVDSLFNPDLLGALAAQEADRHVLSSRQGFPDLVSQRPEVLLGIIA